MGKRRSINKPGDISELFNTVERLEEENESLHKEIDELHEAVGLSSLLVKTVMDALISKGILSQADIEKHMGQTVSVLEPCPYKEEGNICNWDWSKGECPRHYTEETAENCEALPSLYKEKIEKELESANLTGKGSDSFSVSQVSTGQILQPLKQETQIVEETQSQDTKNGSQQAGGQKETK